MSKFFLFISKFFYVFFFDMLLRTMSRMVELAGIYKLRLPTAASEKLLKRIAASKSTFKIVVGRVILH